MHVPGVMYLHKEIRVVQYDRTSTYRDNLGTEGSTEAVKFQTNPSTKFTIALELKINLKQMKPFKMFTINIQKVRSHQQTLQMEKDW